MNARAPGIHCQTRPMAMAIIAARGRLNSWSLPTVELFTRQARQARTGRASAFTTT